MTPPPVSEGPLVGPDGAPGATVDRTGITTDFVYPPIPDRSSDWAAYRDPEGRVGWGRTEEEAINDLLGQEE